MEKAHSKREIYESRRVKRTPPHVDLKSLRQVSGLTLEQLADKIRERTGATYQPPTLSKIESGARGASVKALADIAAGYGLRPDAFVLDYAPRVRATGSAA